MQGTKVAALISKSSSYLYPLSGPTTQGTTVTPMPGSHRTVIFVKKQTNPGQDLFMRGGIDVSLRPECNGEASSACTIPIKVLSH